MGYAVYEDPNNFGRWAGYAVPAECDMPECTNRIYRGMDWLCETHDSYDENDELIEDEGCYLHFCSDHQYETELHEGVMPKGDLVEWKWWLITAPSWGTWRSENPKRVEEYRKAVEEAYYRPTQENLTDLKWDMEESGVLNVD